MPKNKKKLKLTESTNDGVLITFFNDSNHKMSPNFTFNENDFDTYLTNYYNLSDIIESSFKDSKLTFRVTFQTDI